MAQERVTRVVDNSVVEAIGRYGERCGQRSSLLCPQRSEETLKAEEERLCQKQSLSLMMIAK